MPKLLAVINGYDRPKPAIVSAEDMTALLPQAVEAMTEAKNGTIQLVQDGVEVPFPQIFLTYSVTVGEDKLVITPKNAPVVVNDKGVFDFTL